MAKLIFHIDLDAFFASVEKIDNPSLEGKPVVVGASPGHRGVVSTCSYEARKYGVHSAMPISEAYRLCPNAVYLPVRMRRYSEVSKKVISIFALFTPDICQTSIDEAYLDLTGTGRLWGDPESAAKKIKEKLFSETRLTASIGAAANYYVAKIASGINKPNGFTFVEDGSESIFMRALPLSKLWGAGETTQARLKELGIATIEALQDADILLLRRKFGSSGADFLHKTSLGIDPGVVGERNVERSMSGERTFERDTTDREEISACLRGLSDEISQRLLSAGESAFTVFIKLRDADFETRTRRTTLRAPQVFSDELFDVAEKLLLSSWNGIKPIRLIGLGVTGLTRKGVESALSLFDEPAPKKAVAEEAILQILKKGKGKITRARFIPTVEKKNGAKNSQK